MAPPFHTSRHPNPQSKRPRPQRDHERPSATVQAYEAQLVYNQQARAEELYSRNGGRGLMRWQGEGDGEEVWADRHDIIHLLSELPGPSTSFSSKPQARARSPSPTPSSSSSWASLPSDLEETFHLSDPAEIAEYERTKRVQQIARLREARLAEREEQDREVGLLEEEKSGQKRVSWPEEEIPPHAISTLMMHTATSLLASPNPRILESRILTNHARDERFEFLKGRWKLTWDRTKKDAKAKQELLSGRSEKEKKSVGTLIGGYASSDEDESDAQTPPPPPGEELPPSPADLGEEVMDSAQVEAEVEMTGEVEVDEEKKRIRRLKAEEWKRQRALK